MPSLTDILDQLQAAGPAERCCDRERDVPVTTEATDRAARHDRRMQALEELTASVVHGLNNLLGAMAVQSAELLNAAPAADADDIRTSGLQLIHQAALDASGLVQRLRYLSRGESPAPAPPLEPIDLGRVLTDALALARSSWQGRDGASTRPIEATVEIEGTLLVRGVAADLREIAVNLILNAVDAMPQGGRVLVRGVERDGAVIVTCQDTGTGIPQAVLDRIFEPFFTTKGRHGTGLGLVIVQDVVTRLGGEVRVSSEVGVGTTVTLLLPAAVPRLGAQEAVAARMAAADDLALSLAGLSVLVVEDDPVFRSVFTRRLRLDAERVEPVGDGAAALAALAEDHWDLICTDDGLPDGSGRELATKIRRRWPDCAVILVTGSATRPDDPSLAAPEIDAILPKPSTDAELARAVRQARARQAERYAVSAR